MSLEEKEKGKKLKRHAPSREGTRRLLGAIHRRLDVASNSSLYNEIRLEQAYEAVLLCAMAAVQASGYRVRQGEGHHYETIDTLQYTLGIDQQLLKYFQALRRKRHEGLYEGMIAVSDSEVGDALVRANELWGNLQSWFESNHPELLVDVEGPD